MLINACDDCRNEALEVEENYIDANMTEYYIVCEVCDNRENSYDSKEDCIKKWNEENG